MVIGVVGEHHLSVECWLIKKSDYQQDMVSVSEKLSWIWGQHMCWRSLHGHELDNKQRGVDDELLEPVISHNQSTHEENLGIMCLYEWSIVTRFDDAHALKVNNRLSILLTTHCHADEHVFTQECCHIFIMTFGHPLFLGTHILCFTIAKPAKSTIQDSNFFQILLPV